jgi:hypothetical protein
MHFHNSQNGRPVEITPPRRHQRKFALAGSFKRANGVMLLYDVVVVGTLAIIGLYSAWLASTEEGPCANRSTRSSTRSPRRATATIRAMPFEARVETLERIVQRMLLALVEVHSHRGWNHCRRQRQWWMGWAFLRRPSTLK